MRHVDAVRVSPIRHAGRPHRQVVDVGDRAAATIQTNSVGIVIAEEIRTRSLVGVDHGASARQGPATGKTDRAVNAARTGRRRGHQARVGRVEGIR